MIFYLLTFVILVLALATVLTRHIFRSAIYLMGVLALSAGYYLLLGAEFLAGVQILVYVGGIVVLIVFAVMLTQSQDLIHDHPSRLRKMIGFLTSGSFFGLSAWALLNSHLNKSIEMPNDIQFSAQAMGKAFLSTDGTGYLLPFELISILLLAVLISGIVLAKKEKI